MCRLFGFRSREAAAGSVVHELLHAPNALRLQSREHPDGWGVAWYDGDAPRVVRGLEPAHEDEDFEHTASFLHAATIVAHVRKASVGRIAPENTHPFQWERWLFVHNGTLPCWEQCRGPLEEAIEPALRKDLRGDTDSERCFLLFLTHLRRLGDPGRATFAEAATALAATVADVRRFSDDLATRAGEKLASTTFLLTDGSLLLACRRGRTLHLSAVADGAPGHVAEVAISSEDPGTAGQPGHAGRVWRAVPEDTLVGVDAQFRLHETALERLAR